MYVENKCDKGQSYIFSVRVQIESEVAKEVWNFLPTLKKGGKKHLNKKGTIRVSNNNNNVRNEYNEKSVNVTANPTCVRFILV